MRPQHVCTKMATVLVGKLYVKTFKMLNVHCDGHVVFWKYASTMHILVCTTGLLQ